MQMEYLIFISMRWKSYKHMFITCKKINGYTAFSMYKTNLFVANNISC